MHLEPWGKDLSKDRSLISLPPFRPLHLDNVVPVFCQRTTPLTLCACWNLLIHRQSWIIIVQSFLHRQSMEAFDDPSSLSAPFSICIVSYSRVRSDLPVIGRWSSWKLNERSRRKLAIPSVCRSNSSLDFAPVPWMNMSSIQFRTWYAE